MYGFRHWAGPTFRRFLLWVRNVYIEMTERGSIDNVQIVYFFTLSYRWPSKWDWNVRRAFSEWAPYIYTEPEFKGGSSSCSDVAHISQYPDWYTLHNVSICPIYRGYACFSTEPVPRSKHLTKKWKEEVKRSVVLPFVHSEYTIGKQYPVYCDVERFLKGAPWFQTQDRIYLLWPVSCCMRSVAEEEWLTWERL